MSRLQEKYGVTRKAVDEELSRSISTQKIGSIFLQTLGNAIWDSVSSVLFEGAHHVHFRKYGDLPEIRGKQIERGITVHLNKKGEIEFHMDGVSSFRPRVPGDDLFLQEELAKLTDFLLDKKAEETAIALYKEKNILTDTFRPCYAALKCERIRGKMRVFVHLTLEGNPLPKKNRKDGSMRHDFSKKGIVGSDLGPQSIAVTARGETVLENLAERGHESTRKHENREARLLRMMDRSRRATNPDNYNKNGTVKLRAQRIAAAKARAEKDGKEYNPKDYPEWICSKNYKKLRYQYREQSRRNADTRQYANQELANKIRAKGDFLVIEPKNAAKLAKKAKESKVIVKPDGTKRNTRRKRFGKSIHYRCPGFLQADLEKKFPTGHYIEVPAGYRASQYDHTAEEYIKKELSDRVFELFDGTPVQRDMYSSYLLSCPEESFEHIDLKKCKENFDGFLENMRSTIKEIVDEGRTVCNSGITWKVDENGNRYCSNELINRIIAG